MRYYLSTIDPNAHLLAKEHSLGLEVAQYCTAWNMDAQFGETDAVVRMEIDGVEKLTLHAPFNELFPCAIDPMARELAKVRYRQAIALAQGYGIDKIIIHGGYNPKLYYPVWYTAESIVFWKEFIQEVPESMTIALENVLEEEPKMLLQIIREVDDKRLRMCLDIGHVNAYSNQDVFQWLRCCADWITHFHVHNNHGTFDTHNPLADGTIDMAAFLREAEQLCPNASFALELTDARQSVQWLKEEVWNRS